MVPEVWDGEILVYRMGGWNPPLGINLAVDAFGLLIGLITSGLTALVIVYSIVDMKEDSGLGHYYTLMLLLSAGMLGVAFTGDVFNLYVFFEIMSISSYALVAFRRTELSIEGSVKYLVVGSLGTSLVLIGIGLLYGYTGTLNIADMASRLSTVVADPASMPLILVIPLAFFMAGFGIKVGMIPFHAWIPDAYQSAPSAVVVIMAGGTAMVGVGALLRLSYFLFGSSVAGPLLIVLGVITAGVGALMALVQRDLKRLLAYSGISQMGYILFSVGLGTAMGVTGGLFHMLNNALYKSLLFLAVGCIAYRTRTSKIADLGGLARKMPVTAGLFMIGTFAITGVPLFNGFVSKLTIYLAGIDAGYPLVSVFAAVFSALTLTYMIRAFMAVFLGPTPERLSSVKEAPWLMLAPIVILAVICIIIGVIPQVGFDAVEPAQRALLDLPGYIRQVIPGV
jgi:multicomponent Na+:H+ antiporter subunit D